MDTVTNVVNSASRLIFGDGTANNETAGREPVAGKAGEGTAEKPYDKGNEPVVATARTETACQEAVSRQNGPGTANQPSEKGNEPGISIATIAAAKGTAPETTPTNIRMTTPTYNPASSSESTKDTADSTIGSNPNTNSRSQPLTPEHPSHPDAGSKTTANFAPVTNAMPGPNRIKSNDEVTRPHSTTAGMDGPATAKGDADTTLAGAEQRSKEGERIVGAKREDLVEQGRRGAGVHEGNPHVATRATGDSGHATSSATGMGVGAGGGGSGVASAGGVKSEADSPGADKKAGKIDKLMDKLHIHKKHGE